MRLTGLPLVAGGMVAALLLGACRGPAAPGSAAASPAPSASAATSAAADSPSPVQAAASPGRPYGPEALLVAMADSRRPGGVPDQLETDAVASALAEAIWTWDGAPWQTMSVGGSCAPGGCSLDVAGSPAGTAGVDLYSFQIDPAGSVQLVAADLHGYPAELDPELDALARSGIDADRLEGLQLLAAGWLPPPDDGRYRLAYRSGGEEGSPGLDVLVDLETGAVLSVDEVN